MCPVKGVVLVDNFSQVIFTSLTSVYSVYLQSFQVTRFSVILVASLTPLQETEEVVKSPQYIMF